MTNFSQRMGYSEIRSVFQHESLDYETRVAIWNLVYSFKRAYFEKYRGYGLQANVELSITTWIWINHLKRPIDEFGDTDWVWDEIRDCILDGSWYEVYDSIEALFFAADKYLPSASKKTLETLTNNLNTEFQRLLVPYRVLQLKITPIESEVEITALEKTFAALQDNYGARESFQKAMSLLSDRENPDFANSIKESISTVEAVVLKITGRKTLSGGLKTLESKGLTIHPALKTAWGTIYGWTSDENGVRHGAVEASTVDANLAIYMLVSCSAFVSYLIKESRRIEAN